MFKNILITGATGSFGKAFVKRIFEQYTDIERVVVLSRDELKQFEMSSIFNETSYPAIRYFLGDVRDESRLCQAFEGIDVVIHAAALKQVPAAEYNPFEFIKTNILGAQNVINAAIAAGVKKVIALSTDKAAAPINLYGATKLCSDKLFIAANNVIGKRNLSFSVVRYGNVMGSRGSVIPFFKQCVDSGVLPITDPEMTRFNISLDQSVDMVLWALKHSVGGEIFVPKIPSYNILDLARAIGPECELSYIGLRPGEKIHEEMITEADSPNTIDFGDYFAILPSTGRSSVKSYPNNLDWKLVERGFSYNSGDNPVFLSTEELRQLINLNT